MLQKRNIVVFLAEKAIPNLSLALFIRQSSFAVSLGENKKIRLGLAEFFHGGFLVLKADFEALVYLLHNLVLLL